MWSNLGYWKNARKLAEVCADMARKLATAADLRPGEHLLDVDCGCAEQDLLWVREYDVGTILGIENTPLRVDLANASVADAGLGQRIEIRNGSATRCPFAEESFDKIMALECAFHFRTRELFFSKKLIVC
ncbi:MAG: methyltransferase domain-containing protein [Gammaproteobacteria bacterium]|nr:methyltransferase domain-containing protein [Gammaproteobacteria bacterium]